MLKVLKVEYEKIFDSQNKIGQIVPVITLWNDKTQILPCTVLLDGHELYATSRLPSVSNEEVTFKLKPLKIFNPLTGEPGDSNFYTLTFRIFGGENKILFEDIQELWFKAVTTD